MDEILPIVEVLRFSSSRHLRLAIYKLDCEPYEDAAFYVNPSPASYCMQ